ncbi:hypothetical protein D026_4590 [Vibrio parahaemolyticus 605]|nr:hypothetical protein D035_0044 [Vibrio parahaemolyticus VP250]EQL98734.1 hypothetical protein D040_4155 [Vibrio parahaemolyticus NIHCB0603]EQM06702.1 hypothetical protein D045_1149 [Vibrio parahaemolyticus VP-NY4]ETT07494.1 hypothetical protein D026_4590 [Vibrio parahaemolyticus 605]ETX21693.1 hypothetical protein D037_4673 [Vibrio parahaemolyticus IDH02640]ETX51213.1 hypothetical protein D038_4702 [Vibrio parahaemolyticus IDH02189]ETX66252.1 hypothetical protein D034_4650 [Vibrio parahaem
MTTLIVYHDQSLSLSKASTFLRWMRQSNKKALNAPFVFLAN